MDVLEKPDKLPNRPNFSSGPCVKRPGWSLDNLKCSDLLGRSHRSKVCLNSLKEVIYLTKENLEIPDDFKVAIVPGSNTGAFEMALWSMIGSIPVDALAWETFGSGWIYDIKEQLKIKDLRIHKAEYGSIPDLSLVRDESDICFTWNGTTSGVKVPNADWISKNRKGITFCDATSAIFSQNLDWEKIDVATFSWQKCMGGEGGHGILIMSPRAIERLKTFNPNRPLPKLFRLIKNEELIEGIYQGETINTPSMLCVADALDSLLWIKELGGWKKTYEKSMKNFEILSSWYHEKDWISNTVKDENIQSNTSICLEIKDKKYLSLDFQNKWDFIQNMCSILEHNNAAFDIKGHRDAPPGLRIWCGPTVEEDDLRMLLPWLEWSFENIRKDFFN
ncbi:MAG: phosphoserine transaminase [Paracoccaceae bacterium]